MGKQLIYLGFVAAAALVFVACNQNKSSKIDYDTPKKGTIYISVDETFKPVISEQIKVYQSSYPEAHIIASYKSEADCFRDLQKDSTRMVIVARGLTEEESSYFKSSIQFKPQWDALAYDAVAAIVNITSPDSVFTLQQLKKLLTDTLPGRQVVVDGNNATSTVRYLLDTLLHGASFGKNVRAANGSKAVIEYVTQNPGAIGFVGSSWVGSDQDPEQVADSKKIRLALLECKSCGSDIFAKPSQTTISEGKYPLARPLYYILKENSSGLGFGFANFMSLERGQLIFRRAYLAPGKMFFGIRKVV